MAYNLDNIAIALGAKVLVAPKLTVAPDDVSTAWGAAWKDCGAVSENGMTITPNREVEKKRIWQSRGVAKVIVKGQDFATKHELVEWNAVTFPLFYGGGAWTAITGKTGQYRFDVSSSPQSDERMFGYEWKVESYTFRLIIPRAQVSSVGDAKLVNDDWTPVDVGIEGLATAGNPIAYYLTDFPGIAPAA